MDRFLLLLILLLPLTVSIWWNKIAFRNLASDEVLGVSLSSVKIFIISRAFFWFVFGVLLTSFLFAILMNHKGGEATRSLLITGKDVQLGIAATIIRLWRFPLVLASLLTISLSLVGLFLMGKAALKLIPEDTAPDIQFLKARARFFFLGLSLMIPPLLLGLLLSF
ncbi:MAG: hypothetical protein ABI444_04645 [Candidatus Kapaibacterium sp.]|jgi:hypothetical protein